MPFVAQCPHPDCKKYMLLEDSARGGTVQCLVCKRPVVLETPGGGESQVSAPAAEPPSSPPSSTPETRGAGSTGRQQIAKCPKCNTGLRLPSSHQGKPIRCPHCGFIFTA